ncbi:hypothetical protein AMAG_03088 [Allomyces macrogynus ATCC 38327]|uniref:Uncharacterized protein n=1 Tax=Allomyces macrogynus (strain ATCC 38327) TaxID=578462 RepID=A0A0L0S4C5_ALLM3|nr:hypothetical protein AMAG_03088 [Allomyces macrogynus ATCC 38327]|eukprot:KNE57367.1 hypothetical protein AMAG_03088 [Allomyces macrogynus ATCC 38327]
MHAQLEPAAPAQVHALHELPTDVLHAICAWVNATDRLSLVHLALAAPSLFAPAVQAALRFPGVYCGADRTPREFEVELVSLPGGDFLYSNDHFEDHVGLFVTLVSEDDDADHLAMFETRVQSQWFLALPCRDRNRAPLPLAGSARSDEKLVAFAKWSLVPVRADTIGHYAVNRRTCSADYPRRMWPPQCCDLYYIGDLGHFRDTLTLAPTTLRRLTLCHTVLSSFEEAQHLWLALLPMLATLSIDLADFRPIDQSALVSIVQALPVTLRELHLYLPETSSAIPPSFWSSLAAALANLICLETFTLRTFVSPAGLVAVMAKFHCLSRLRRVALGVAIVNDQDAAICNQIVQLLPVDLEQLKVDVILGDEDDDDVDPAPFEPMMLNQLPTASIRDLALNLPNWHASVGRTLQLSPHLTRLALTSFDGLVDVLWDLFPRLPATLRALELTSWQLDEPGALSHFASHLPPRLQRLQMQQCNLGDADFTDLAHHWPLSLTHLDLQFNDLALPPVPLPPKLRVLNLRQNPLDGDFANEWVPELPPTLRRLNVDETGSAICDLAPLLLDVLPSRCPWERITLTLDMDELEDQKEVLNELQAAFFVTCK